MANYLRSLQTLILGVVHAGNNFGKSFSIFHYFRLCDIIGRITISDLTLLPLNIFYFFTLDEDFTSRLRSLVHWIVDWLLLVLLAANSTHIAYACYTFSLLMIHDVFRNPAAVLLIPCFWRNFQNHCGTRIMDTANLTTNEIMKHFNLTV